MARIRFAGAPAVDADLAVFIIGFLLYASACCGSYSCCLVDADASQGGVRLENLVPAVFPAYCKLFHPIYVDPEVSGRSTSWHQAESQGRPDLGVLAGLRAGGTLVRESSDGRVKGERVRWRELAERYGLTFHSEIHADSLTKAFGGSWPRYLLGPDEGRLDDETCDALVSVLGPLTGAVPCYFYYSGLSVFFSTPEGFPAHFYRGHWQMFRLARTWRVSFQRRSTGGRKIVVGMSTRIGIWRLR